MFFTRKQEIPSAEPRDRKLPDRGTREGISESHARIKIQRHGIPADPHRGNLIHFVQFNRSLRFPAIQSTARFLEPHEGGYRYLYLRRNPFARSRAFGPLNPS